MIDSIITMVLDSSASMDAVAAETIEGFNSFVTEQRKVTDDCWLNLVMFSDVRIFHSQHTVRLVWAKRNIHTCQPLDSQTFDCEGGTPLFDAIGRAIEWTDEQTTSPDAEMAQVYVVILTDGKNTCSELFTADKVREMVLRKRKTEGWNFIFLGANQDAEKVARELGILDQSALTYAGNKAGTKKAILEAGRAVRKSRTNDQPALISDEAKNEQRLLLSGG